MQQSGGIVDHLSPFNGGSEATMRRGAHAGNVTDPERLHQFALA